jgi:integrase
MAARRISEDVDE